MPKTSDDNPSLPPAAEKFAPPLPDSGLRRNMHTRQALQHTVQRHTIVMLYTANLRLHIELLHVMSRSATICNH